MKRPPPSFADRMVMAVGFLAMLATGFFGAELPQIEPAARAIPYIQTQSDPSP
jgi:hypothetical protein